MSSDPFFGDAMHFLGANLDFKLVPALGHHSGMQRLVKIRSRHGNEILDTAGHGAPDAVNQTENCITILHGLSDDADRQQVVNLVHSDALALQLLIDGIKPFDPPINAGGDVMFDESFVQYGIDVAEKLFALLPVRFDGGADRAIAQAARLKAAPAICRVCATAASSA